MSSPWNQDNDEEEDLSKAPEPVCYMLNTRLTIMIRSDWWILALQEDYSNHDSILFVIDASTAMLQPQENGEIPLQSAFKCVQSVLLSKAFSSPSDSVGVLVYGTVWMNSVR
jgi:hypothetical protein